MLRRLLRWGLSLLVLLLGAGMLHFSRMDFMLVGSADEVVSIFRPPFWAQWLAVLLLPVATIIALGPGGQGRGGWALRGAFLTTALLAYGFSVHSVTLDPRNGSVNDVWGIFRVRRFLFSEGAFEGFPRQAFSRHPCMLWIHEGTEGRWILFLGVPPWNIDAEAILSDPTFLPAEGPDSESR